jgi:nucleoside-diphosphate-sugar epimerase
MEKTVQTMKRILVTGASGFLGEALALRLSAENEVMGLYHNNKPLDDRNIIWEKTDLSSTEAIEKQIQRFSPDIIIHSAAIAHQSLQTIDRDTYFAINSIATENIARAAYQTNPDVQFIFLSSISVYGEQGLSMPVTESHECNPTSDYGKSKLDAENRLLELLSKNQLQFLTILRLAPVYDKTWSHNLDRRVLAPFKLAYLKFGSGKQQMSALARPNLLDLINYLINEGISKSKNSIILNVCDKKPYAFHEIINVFRKSILQPARPVVFFPLFFIFAATRVIGLLFPGKREWIHACYEKLALSLVFDNKKMLATGFLPSYDLGKVFSSR